MPDRFLLYLLYLFYGMAFFAMGVSITSRDTSASNLKIAPLLWLFGLFAYTHAFHEWFELYLVLFSPSFSPHIGSAAFPGKLALMLISFGFLLLFGVSIFRAVFAWQWYRLLPVPLMLVAAWLLSLLFSGMDLSPSFFSNADIRARNFVGFPGAVITGLGFLFYSRTVRQISRPGAISFAGAGYSMIGYGVLAGLVPSGTTLPPGAIPVELLRGMAAFVILHFLMNALHTFDIEQKLLITERLNRFAKSEKLHSLGKLAFGVAHEINNPLTNVSINVELLKKGIGQGDAVAEKRFAAIERNLDRATKIARELLYFSSQKESHFQETDLNDVLAGTLDLLGSRRNAYRIMTNLQAVPPVAGIPWKLEEVFLNVFLNAMEAMPGGGTLTISTARRGGEVVAEIVDTGPGIPPEHIDSVLDPFFTTKEVGLGTGLGLSICFAIMELHGGRIELESPPGKGVTVRLVFPEGAASDVHNSGS